MTATIRMEQPDDIPAIHQLTQTVFAVTEFGHHGEAGLIDGLRTATEEFVSLVAEQDGEIIGHILFTPVKIQPAQTPTEPPLKQSQNSQGMGLAPMSVATDFQRQGIGSQLVNAGIKILREQGQPFLVVLGHPEFYSRFGFVPASTYNIASEYPDLPDDYFRILVLSEQPIPSGCVTYHPEFSKLG